MGLSKDELLQPSLTQTPIAQVPYSVLTTFVTSFFGGPLAAIVITAINSMRLRRWGRDLAPLGIALITYVGFMFVLVGTEWGVSFRVSIDELALGAASYLHRLIGLALFGLGFALHRKEQRSADVMGLDRPNGWIAGLACIAAGTIWLVALDRLVAVREGS